MSKKYFNGSPDEQSFGVVEVEKEFATLPPALYVIQSTMSGIRFEKKKYDTSELIVIEDSLVTSCINEIKSFWTKKDLFASYNFPFKRGILLFGAPGYGKSCALKLIMNDVIKMGGIGIQYDSAELFMIGLKLFRKVQPETPVVVLMEDIDNIILYDEANTTDVLDGFNDIQNVVFVATTNSIDDLSDRIRDRPGRFDKRIEVGPPSEKIRKIYLESINSRPQIKPSIDIDLLIKDTDGMSFAQMKECYISIVLFESDYKETIGRIKEMSSDLSEYSIKNKDPFDAVELARVPPEMKKSNGKTGVIGPTSKHGPTGIQG